MLRFIAFALVSLYHSVPPPNGHLKLASLAPTLTPVLLTFSASGRYGVSVFFVLSAFLLCELLLREKQATGSIQVGQFYIRRIARIWPHYYLILALGILFAMIPGNPSAAMKQIGWYAIFMAPISVVHYGWTPIPSFHYGASKLKNVFNCSFHGSCDSSVERRSLSSRSR